MMGRGREREGERGREREREGEREKKGEREGGRERGHRGNVQDHDHLKFTRVKPYKTSSCGYNVSGGRPI